MFLLLQVQRLSCNSELRHAQANLGSREMNLSGTAGHAMRNLRIMMNAAEESFSSVASVQIGL